MGGDARNERLRKDYIFCYCPMFIYKVIWKACMFLLNYFIIVNLFKNYMKGGGELIVEFYHNLGMP